MKDNDYEQLSNKDRLSRAVKKNPINQDEQQSLQLADEHLVPSAGRKTEANSTAKKGNPALKTVFWLLRKLIAPIIMVIMLATGLYVGYVIIADQPSDEVFKFETWKHLWDLIFADS